MGKQVFEVLPPSDGIQWRVSVRRPQRSEEGLARYFEEEAGLPYTSQLCILFPRRKQMATPISDIPISIIASASEMAVPVAITPTVTPTRENNHRIIRSPPYQQVGLTIPCPNEQIYAIFAPMQIHWNIYEIGPMSRGGRHINVREAHHCTDPILRGMGCCLFRSRCSS